jgi:hypothetical protein
MPSEKYAARRGSLEDGMCLITACFTRAYPRWTSRPYMHFSLIFQEVRPISKTRNQLTVTHEYVKRALDMLYEELKLDPSGLNMGSRGFLSVW